MWIFLAPHHPGPYPIRPVEPFVLPWASSPRKFWHILDVGDFNAPLRGREGYFANYPASKAVSEKVVCGSNNENLRTGCAFVLQMASTDTRQVIPSGTLLAERSYLGGFSVIQPRSVYYAYTNMNNDNWASHIVQSLCTARMYLLRTYSTKQRLLGLG